MWEERVRIYSTLGVHNNFPWKYIICYTFNFFFFFCFGKYKNIGILKKLDFKKLSILFIRLINKKKIKQALSIPKKERGILQYLYKFGYGNPKVNWLHLTQISLSSNFNVFKNILFYFSLLFWYDQIEFMSNPMIDLDYIMSK